MAMTTAEIENLLIFFTLSQVQSTRTPGGRDDLNMKDNSPLLDAAVFGAGTDGQHRRGVLRRAPGHPAPRQEPCEAFPAQPPVFKRIFHLWLSNPAPSAPGKKQEALRKVSRFIGSN